MMVPTLYLDGTKIIDNDGVHATKAVTTTMDLTAGQKAIAVDYFQGPRYHITLQLLWKVPGSDEYTVIPKEYFHRQK